MILPSGAKVRALVRQVAAWATRMSAINGSAAPSRLGPIRNFTVNRFRMARLYGRAGRLTAQNGGFRLGQVQQELATMADEVSGPACIHPRLHTSSL